MLNSRKFKKETTMNEGVETRKGGQNYAFYSD
jgi:hypothetical protein